MPLIDVECAHGGRITTPDQGIMIQLQDAPAPQLFVVSTASEPARVIQMLTCFQPYASGVQCAVLRTYGQKYGHFSITDLTPAPMPPNMWLPPDVNSRRGTVGSAFFTFESNGQPVAGAAFAATTPRRLPVV